MQIKSATSQSHVFAAAPTDWSLRRIALITVGALLLAPVVPRLDSAAKAAERGLLTPSEHAACMEVSPGAANLLGAMEGQPPIPTKGVWAAVPSSQGGCPAL